jgi:multidrug efflux pump subunit AcrB
VARKTVKSNDGAQFRRFQRLSLWFFKRPRQTAFIWIVIAVFGAVSYATLLKREGFPAINTPYAIAKGSYLVNDPAKVDTEIAKPLNDYFIKQDGVKSVQSQSFGNFYVAYVLFKDNINADTRSKSLGAEVNSKHLLPAKATFTFVPYEFGFTERGDDMVVSFYSKTGSQNTEDLIAKANKAADFIRSKHLSLVRDVSAINPFEQAYDTITGQKIDNQKSFDRFGQRTDAHATFYTSVVIGIQADSGTDNLKLDKQVQSAVDELNQRPEFKDYKAVISASYAPDIRDQIDVLQKSLLEGLGAVLIVGSIVIALRASIITVLSMLTVIAAVNGLLYLIGYSLNTITMFALILGLSLIVDDTIIMVEALDAQRRKQKRAEIAVEQATRKVSRAMVAATSTAVLSFAPLIFVGGILGKFIRAIPITIMSALIISLFVALIFIPLFARFLLLGKKQMGEGNVREVAASIEAFIARFISGPMLWAKGNTKKLFLVGIVALLIGTGFIGAGGYLFKKVKFNIFPPAKDGNQLMAHITFRPNTNIDQAQQVADQADKLISNTLGNNFVKASYYGQANIDQAMLYIYLTDYRQREPTAPQLIKTLNDKFASFKPAEIEVQSLDAGPPASPFTVQIKSGQDRQAALKLAGDIAHYLQYDTTLKRPDGSVAKIKNVSIGNSSIYVRKDAVAYVTVDVKFVDDDTTTLVTLGKDAINKHFAKDKIAASYGLPKDAIQYDTGQEQENQDSFKTLALAFPILLVAIYILLSFQFRSLLQPILIFMALPFSLFGITLGLWLTNNPFSFFAMLGFFALIGLSIKNTILLTDYANQARASGLGTVDSIHEALAERFRPLIATSLTAVFSLIPLTLSSPFWEGLGVTLIFGLLSSTFLVITVFPYYYLGAEYMRQHINRRTGIAWVILTIALAIPLKKAAILAPLISVILIKIIKLSYRKARA